MKAKITKHKVYQQLSSWRTVVLFFVLTFMGMQRAEAQYTAIPDANFEHALFSLGIDTLDGDHQVLTSAISGVTTLDVSNKGIANLTGIEGFTSLTSLSCSNNTLASLNVSASNGLTTLNCSYNQLTNLNISGCYSLQTLYCYYNQLTTIDLTGFTSLQNLFCFNNQLTNLNVNGCVALQALNCYYNQLTSLNVSSCNSIMTLNCFNNELTTINVGGLSNLYDFDCSSNLLTNLDITGCTILESLYCYNNQLTSLNTSNFINLNNLYCFNNQITTLNVGGCTTLNTLDCANNQLTSLDLSNVPFLLNLDCTINQNLTCIIVPNPVATASITSWIKDASATYSINCTNIQQFFCNKGTVANLIPNGANIKWYGNPSGGTKFPLTAILTTNIYYYTITNAGIEGPRTPVAVTVNKVLAPIASNQTFCFSGSVSDLVATGSNIKWYSTSTGGSPLSPTLALVPANYYASQTINGCESPTRKGIIVKVNSTVDPTAPSPQTFCYGSKVSNLVATGTSLKWYILPVGGTALTTTTILNSGTYYVSQKINTCESLRVAVSVIVNVTPPPAATALTLCSGSKISDLIIAGTGIKWYSTVTGGAALAGTTALVTKTYYASQTIDGCEGMRTAIPVTIITTPSPSASFQSFTFAATVADLVATGSNILWYSSSTGGTPLDNSTLLVTNTLYYCSQTVNGCESSRRAVFVKVTVALVGNSTHTEVVKMETLLTTFTIYPNPTKSILSVETSNNNAIDRVVVVDLLGKVILDETPVNNEINVERFVSGTYILQVYSGEEMFVTKFIKN